MKKIFCTLLMLICMFSLTACNSEKEPLAFDKGVVSLQAETLYTVISGIGSDDWRVEEFEKANIYDLQYISDEMYKSDARIHVSGEAMLAATKSYNSALDEMGEIKPLNQISYDAKEDELIVTYYLDGSKHDGSLEIIYDKNLTVTSITTNVDYSFEELMAKAGTNTAIGMGTVFVMLIIIMIIIMILGLVPKIFEKKPAKEEAKDGVDKAIEGIVAREEAEEADDTELVAVIAAAIAAYEGTSTDGFVVRSIKRIK